MNRLYRELAAARTDKSAREKYQVLSSYAVLTNPERFDLAEACRFMGMYRNFKSYKKKNYRNLSEEIERDIEFMKKGRTRDMRHHLPQREPEDDYRNTAWPAGRYMTEEDINKMHNARRGKTDL